MIRLTKHNEPAILVSNKVTWQNSLNNELGSGLSMSKCPSSTKYNHPTVKSVLMLEANNKCIYCESNVRHVDHGEIEHLKPKAMFPLETFLWDNLGFACAKCNNAKSDKYDAALPIINPFTENPSDHLVVLGQYIFSKPGSDRGQMTIQTVDLNRVELAERRSVQIKQLHTLLEKLNRVPDGVKQAVLSEVKNFIDDSGEYSFTMNATIKACS